jgi:geranylgeranyl diphosphate synthase type I
MELIQSAFLIHDDIMDRDEFRRGEASLFWRYKAEAESQKLPDAYHYGESMGMCAGDGAFFLAFDLLSTENVPEKISSLCAQE